ncbi:MAG: hypothetical protein Q4F97_08705 [Bacteroidales bacterium]|nr:hypothetical protein [Bacteroidales bacterium]
MKKIIYTLFAVALLIFSSCADMENFNSIDQGTAPTVSLEISNISDSTFSFVINPGTDAKYYSYLVEEANEPSSLDAISLLGGKYSDVLNNVILKDTLSTFTSNMRGVDGKPLAKPNTTYQIYAVACNEKGVIGDIAIKAVTCTDGSMPTIEDWTKSSKNTSIDVEYSESLVRGDGKVSLKYFAALSGKFSDDFILSDNDFTIEDNIIKIVLPDSLPGAYAFVSWEEGAFTDLYGNKCSALNSGLNSQGQARGIYTMIPNVEFGIADSCFVAPVKKRFNDWKNFQAIVKLGTDLYLDEDELSKGDIQVVYTNKTKFTSYNLDPSLWSVKDSSIIISLPIEPEFDDVISININEGILFDQYGNTNTAYTMSEGKWVYEEVFETIGKFTTEYVSLYDDEIYDYGVITIIKSSSPVKENQVFIDDFLINGSRIEAYLDETAKTLTIYPILPICDYDGNTYYIYGEDPYVFNIKEDGSMVCLSTFTVVYGTVGGPITNYLDECDHFTFLPVSEVPSESKKVKHVFPLKKGKAF